MSWVLVRRRGPTTVNAMKVTERQPLRGPPRAASRPSCRREYCALSPCVPAEEGAPGRKTCRKEPETVRAMSGSVQARKRQHRVASSSDRCRAASGTAQAASHRPRTWLGIRPRHAGGTPGGSAALPSAAAWASGQPLAMPNETGRPGRGGGACAAEARERYDSEPWKRSWWSLTSRAPRSAEKEDRPASESDREPHAQPRPRAALASARFSTSLSEALRSPSHGEGSVSG
mmetsp:Transcript_589/g.2012  ORF Transcript_589/g.2012 Transcript_589/m.2012 type:complete len:231 (+) Transcript_589:831-1523(+)